MSKTRDVVILSKRGHDFIHLVFKIDKLWRKLATSAASGRISAKTLYFTAQTWDKLIEEMQSFLAVLWSEFENWKSGNVEFSEFLLKRQGDKTIFKTASSIWKKHGKLYTAVINSDFGEQLISQCKSLDSCFVILQYALKVCDDSHLIINKIIMREAVIVKKMVHQLKRDTAVLEDSDKQKNHLGRVGKEMPSRAKKRIKVSFHIMQVADA